MRLFLTRRTYYLSLMVTLFIGAVAVFVLYLGMQMLRTVNPAALARAIKIAGGVLALAMAAFTGIKGQLAVALPLGFFGAGLLGWAPFGGGFRNIGGAFGDRFRRSTGKTSTVRSQFLDMTLSHDSGSLSGQIIAGTHVGRSLDEFDLSQLMAMASEFDAESAVLLESYLDRRFPAWREHPNGQGAGRNSGPPASGKMSNEEAYQILGLKPGAGPAEIGSAHRSLMKKFHPDQGGTTYLAARINEAKDTLLRTHRS